MSRQPTVRVTEGFRTFVASIGSSWSEAQRENFSETTVKILGRSLADLHQSQYKDRNRLAVQLVVGQVQSGKTSSFQALMRLARDNGFPLVYLLGGTTKILLGQSVARMRRDFREGQADEESPWDILALPDTSDGRLTPEAVYEKARRNLDEWTRLGENSPYRRSTVIASLKNIRVSHVGEVIRRLGETFPGLRVLVIDDEADQAGINTQVNSDEVSPTHERLTDLQELDVDVAYVMYTATPAAPLLTRIGSALSPDSLTVITPGEGYCGPKELFLQENQFHRPIPEGDEVDPAEPVPDSLKDALHYFLLAMALLRQESMSPQLRPISMLVHPSRLRANHLDVANHIQRYLEALSSKLSAEDGGKQFASRFQQAKSMLGHSDAASDVLSAKTDDDWAEAVYQWMRYVQVALINSDNNPPGLVPGITTPQEITNWNERYGWILVGGDKLNRGFTVHNLVVTYLARNPARTDDTNLQRARFFGYRQAYGSFLRGWMSMEAHDTYREGSVHNEHMLIKLKEIDDESIPVREWSRVIFSGARTLPTRLSAIDGQSFSIRSIAKWVFVQRDMFVQSPEESSDALAKVCALRDKFGSQRFAGDVRTRSDREHHSFTAPLTDVGEFLSSVVLSAEERAVIDEYLLAILDDAAARGQELSMRVILMDNLVERVRGQSGQPSSLFTGSDKTGDEHMFDGDMWTVQVHRILGGVPEAPRICLALRAPSRLQKTAVVDNRRPTTSIS